jgi:hypothetical protein
VRLNPQDLEKIACLNRSSSPLLKRLERDPESRRFQYRTQAPKLRITGLGEHFVRRLARQFRFTGDLGDATLRLGNLTERDHNRTLIAVLDHGLEIGSRMRGIPKLPDQPRLVRNASGDCAAFPARCAFCSPGNIPWHA